MRRVGLFLSRFSLGLWVALVCASAFLLLFNAPTAPDAPFSSVAIAAKPDVYLPTRIFDCIATDQQFQCETAIQNRSLTVTWQKGGAAQNDLFNPPYPENCEAVYDGQAVGCNSKGMGSVLNQPDRYEVTELGLSAQQLRAVRQKYWGVNTLQKLSEPRLMRVGIGLALLGGVSAACFAWLQPGWLSNLFVSLACGFGMYLSTWNFLGRLPYDIAGNTDETIQDWSLTMQGGALTAGIAAMLLVILMLQRRNNRLPKAIASLVSGIGTAALFSYLTLFTLLWLGYAD
ncbi:MAG: hypothetical protein ACR2FS_12490 [Phormidesmis sp.]